MPRDDRQAEAVAGLILTLATLLYLLMAMYALLPEWKKEQVRLYLKRQSSQPREMMDYATERAVAEFRRTISRWEHEQNARDN